MNSVHIIGGDKRQVYLRDMLCGRGVHASIEGFEKLGIAGEMPRQPEWVLLPVPYKTPDGYIKAPFAKQKTGLADIATRFPAARFALGRSDSESESLLGGRAFDLLADEAFLIENAALTAQGAVAAYLQSSETSLTGARCVVVGYGRIGKALCALLGAFTPHVTATARKPKDLALIESAALQPLHTRDAAQALRDADVVFNTVPQHVLGEKELDALKPGAALIELASPPYGMDISLAKQMGVNVRVEPGLPGRWFPKSAAAAMLRAFERINKEGE